MKIQVTFFKETGKYYSGGEVEIDNNIYLHSNNFKQEIVNNQNILQDGWQGNYYVLTDSIIENHLDKNYNKFYTYLFKPEDFKGIKKNNLEELKQELDKRLDDTIRLFRSLGFAHESNCEFYITDKEDSKFPNKIGLKVGVIKHTCDIDSSEFILLMFLDNKGKPIFESFGELWVTKL